MPTLSRATEVLHVRGEHTTVLFKTSIMCNNMQTTCPYNHEYMELLTHIDKPSFYNKWRKSQKYREQRIAGIPICMLKPDWRAQRTTSGAHLHLPPWLTQSHLGFPKLYSTLTGLDDSPVSKSRLVQHLQRCATTSRFVWHLVRSHQGTGDHGIGLMERDHFPTL